MANYIEVRKKFIYTSLWDIVMDIKRQLHNGKLKVVKKQSDDNIRVTCPHHKGGQEDTPDCDIYIGPTIKDSKGNIIVAYGTVNCFACEFKGNFVKFVAECFDKSYEWAENWLIENYASDYTNTYLDLPPIVLSKSKKTYLDESILNEFEDFHPYMLERKLTKEVIKEFEIKYDPKTECLVFPVRDEKGKLWMLTRRSVNSKKFIIDKEKQKPVYLLYYLKKRNIQEAYVCESQINALSIWTHHLPAIALFGTGSEYQYDLLNKSGIRVFNLMFDGDEAGEKGIREFLKNIRKDVVVNIIRLPKGKDINDLSYDEVEKLIADQLQVKF